MHGWEAIAQGNGYMLMLVGMSVVFTALVVLMFVMKGLKRYQEAIHTLKLNRKRAAEQSEFENPTDSTTGKEEVPGVVMAAISLTIIFEQEQVHDHESMVLTLQSLPRPYSNWWQGRIDPAWSASRTPSRVTALQATDPERGKKI